MKLIKATEEFVLGGVSYPGFPVLLDGDMEIVKPAMHFLVYQCITCGRVGSVHSWWTYGQAMYDYFGFLEGRERDWRNYSYDDDHSLLAAYRDWSIKDLGLKSNSVNQRLRVIIRFYRYAHRKGWVGSLPFDMETVVTRRPPGFLAHTDRSGGVRRTPDVLLREQKPSIKILTKGQIQELLTAAKNPTLNLFVRMGLQTGLRLQELLTFPLKYVVNPERSDAHRSIIRVNCDPKDMTLKGRKPRGIDVPRTLMHRLWDYRLHERHQLIVAPDADPGTLFVNRFGRAFAKTSSTPFMRLNGLGLSFHVHPHMLRHTYATNTLHYMRRQRSKTDPLLYVRERLGHASIHTTMFYLHYLDQVEDELITQYQEEIDSI
jgi:integrase/recombinase XerD